MRTLQLESRREVIEPRPLDSARLRESAQRDRKSQYDSECADANGADHGSVRPRPVECRRRVTLLALRTEAAGVHIVRGVTGAADHGGLTHVLRLNVALAATDLRVCTGQRKPRARRVIEFPQLPSVGRVTGRALLAQRALVNVVLRMAANALMWRLLEALRRVTLAACDDCVQAQERKAGEVVIEGHVLPVGRVVTLFALAAESATVRLIRPMATGTVGRERMILRNACMAGVAVEL